MNIGYIVLLCIVDVGLFATKSLITFALFCFGMHIVFKNKKPELKTQPKEYQAGKSYRSKLREVNRNGGK